jgi:hypothetical protein
MRCTEVTESTQDHEVWWRVDPYTAMAQDAFSGVLLTYHKRDLRIVLNLPAAVVTNVSLHRLGYDKIMSRILPEGWVVTNRKNRWYLVDLATRVRTPLYEGITLRWLMSGGWTVDEPIPMWDNTGINKPIQRMVKRWAAAYDIDDKGACGLCTWTDAGSLAHSLDEGRMARQHLIEHVLAATLPHPFMYGIVTETWAGPHTYIMAYRAATYRLAVTYAYNHLRTPVATPTLAGAF